MISECKHHPHRPENRPLGFAMPRIHAGGLPGGLLTAVLILRCLSYGVPGLVKHKDNKDLPPFNPTKAYRTMEVFWRLCFPCFPCFPVFSAAS